MSRLLAAGAAALLVLAALGCGAHDRADLTGPAMALPRATVAMLAVDLHPGGDEAADARGLAAAVGYDSPLTLAGPVTRELAEDLGARGAIFLLPARDGRGLNAGALAEARDPGAALDAARLIRPLVRAERRRRGGAVRAGTDPVHALARLRASPTAAAAAGRWVVWGDPRAVRAAVVAANGRSLGETVPFRRAVENFRGPSAARRAWVGATSRSTPAPRTAARPCRWPTPVARRATPIWSPGCPCTAWPSSSATRAGSRRCACRCPGS